ncbi:MAG: YccF domain-containing protein [Proteobacteria bacterium]|nr:YccF domain-containing protein [Pseudomonadota bacterium]
MRLIGNLIWFLFGGIFMGLGWWLAGCLAFLSIIGIPWGRACFVIGKLAFWPFGKQVVDRSQVTGQQDIGTGAFGTVGNILWFILAGIWLAIGHLLSALACFITIIGIPFGLQHLKLAGIALAPIGKTVVPGAMSLQASGTSA